jgi:excisionase family DNA binding protein
MQKATDTGAEDRLLISEREAGRVLSVSPRTVFSLVQRGELRAVRVGSRKLVELKSLHALIARGGCKGGEG